MTTEKKNVLLIVKDAAFPILVTIIGLFLLGFYNNQNKMIDLQQAEQVHFQKVDDRLDQLEKVTTVWQTVFFKSQLAKHADADQP